MFPNMQIGQLPEVPTREELWKNEKSKYRHWVILFAISIVSFGILFIVSLILNVVGKDSIIAAISQWAIDEKVYPHTGNGAATVGDYDWADDFAYNNWKYQLVMTTAFQAAIVLIGIVLFFSTLTKVYKEKSFVYLSSWATFAIGLGAIIGIWRIFNFTYVKSMFAYSEGIFSFLLLILPIIIWVFVSIPLGRIKKQFMFSERINAIKNSPQYKNAMQQMQNQNGATPSNGMGPFGPASQPYVQQPFNPTNSTNTNQAQSNSNQSSKTAEELKIEKRTKELSSMTIAELKMIAQQLSISGYTTMKKKELIDAIIRVSEA